MTEAEYIKLLEKCLTWIGMAPQSLEAADEVFALRYKVVVAINEGKKE